MGDVESTVEYQFLAQCTRYLEAAHVIVTAESFRPLLLAPTLHLVAHGLEVLLKHTHIRGGKTEQQVRDEFGHDLQRLWEHPENIWIRERSLIWAEAAWETAKLSGKYPDTFNENPKDVLEEHISALSRLHSRASGYALRYTIPPNKVGPRPRLLIDTFIPVKDESLRQLNPDW